MDSGLSPPRPWSRSNVAFGANVGHSRVCDLRLSGGGYGASEAGLSGKNVGSKKIRRASPPILSPAASSTNHMAPAGTETGREISRFRKTTGPAVRAGPGSCRWAWPSFMASSRHSNSQGFSLGSVPAALQAAQIYWLPLLGERAGVRGGRHRTGFIYLTRSRQRHTALAPTPTQRPNWAGRRFLQGRLPRRQKSPRPRSCSRHRESQG